MVASNMGESRRAPRVRVTWKAQAIYRKQVVDIRVFDISAAGIGFLSPESFRVGDEVLLKLNLPNATNRSRYSEAILTAVVRHQRMVRGSLEVGARFSRIDARALAVIEAWVASGGQDALLPKAPSASQPPQAGDATADIDRHEHPDASGRNEAD